MAYTVIYLGKYAFPCAASHHETRRDAFIACEQHAKAHNLSISREAKGGTDKYTQLLTKDESLNSYVIIEDGHTDEEHSFGDIP